MLPSPTTRHERLSAARTETVSLASNTPSITIDALSSKTVKMQRAKAMIADLCGFGLSLRKSVGSRSSPGGKGGEGGGGGGMKFGTMPEETKKSGKENLAV